MKLALMFSLIVFTASNGSAQLDCNAGLYLKYSQEAESLAVQFRALKKISLEKKIDGFIKHLGTQKNTTKSVTLLTNIKGRQNILGELYDSSVGRKDKFEEVRDVIQRVQSVLAQTKYNLKQKAYRPQIHPDIEFSVNSLIDVVAARLRSVRDTLQASHDKAVKECLSSRANNTSEIKNFAKFSKDVLFQGIFFGEVVNPIRKGLLNGKYNLAITRLEGINHRIKPETVAPLATER